LPNNFIGMFNHMIKQNKAKKRALAANRKRRLKGHGRPRRRGPVRPIDPVDSNQEFDPRYDGLGPDLWGIEPSPEEFGRPPEGFGPPPEMYGPAPEWFGPHFDGFGSPPEPRRMGPPELEDDIESPPFRPL